MSLEEFEEKLSALGADLTLWPQEDRQAAESLLETSKPARDMLALERLLRKELEAKPEPAPQGLTQRIFDKAFGRKSDES